MKKRIILVSLICIMLMALALPMVMAPDNPLPALGAPVAVGPVSAMIPLEFSVIAQGESYLASLVEETQSIALLSIAMLIVLALLTRYISVRQSKSTASPSFTGWGFSTTVGY